MAAVTAFPLSSAATRGKLVSLGGLQGSLRDRVPGILAQAFPLSLVVRNLVEITQLTLLPSSSLTCRPDRGNNRSLALASVPVMHSSRFCAPNNQRKCKPFTQVENDTVMKLNTPRVLPRSSQPGPLAPATRAGPRRPPRLGRAILQAHCHQLTFGGPETRRAYFAPGRPGRLIFQAYRETIQRATSSFTMNLDGTGHASRVQADWGPHGPVDTYFYGAGPDLP